MAEPVSKGIEGNPSSEAAEAAAASSVVVSSRRAAIRAYRGEIVFASALSAYAILAVLAYHYDYFGWDVSLGRAIQSVDLPGFAIMMRSISVLGNGWVPVLIVCAAGLGLAVSRLTAEALICVVGAATSSGMNRLWKLVIGRPRPSEPLVQVIIPFPHESFPSGHVVFFVVFFGFVFFLTYVLLRRGVLRRSLLVLSGALIVLIGVSRVYLGAHWPSDVFGAYLAGGIWLMLMIEAYRRLKSRQTKPG